MELFDNLFTLCNSSKSLDSFLYDNQQTVTEFYNSQFNSIKEHQESIEKFILLRYQHIENLDYTKSYNRAFISILLDFCERFNFISATPRIYSVLEKNGINIGHRLQAALLFLYNIDSNPTLVDRFDFICQNLQTAIELEEDNDRKALFTFLNYYSIIIRDTHVKYALEIKSKIEYSLTKNIFSFLNCDSIRQALKIDLNNAESAFEKIQSIIDFLLEKTECVKPVIEQEAHVLFIEADTEYSKILNNTAKTFKAVRNISINKINGIIDKDKVYNSLGRGVAILENESQMYYYMKSFGSSHHAKMLSALGEVSFEQIEGDIEVFDWSCGQGLASMVFYEFMEKKSLSLNIKTLTLIEPSNICLKRAALHVKHFDKNCVLRTICKDIDSLDINDVKCNANTSKFHFFSNILDVEDFSITQLIRLIENTQKGLNFFVCVSPFITDIKTNRVDSFCRHFSHYNTFDLLKSKTNGGRREDEYWNCNNKYKENMCYNHPNACNGEKKWTRVIRVFKISL